MPSSQYAQNRDSGKFQSEEQRDSILDAAEKLFLEAGIEKVTMQDIAQRAGITRVTLYRYFANRDEIAVGVLLHQMKKNSQRTQSDPPDRSLEGLKRHVRSMIRNYPQLRDSYRYNGMFDKIYLDNPPDSATTRWTFNQLRQAGFSRPVDKEDPQENALDTEVGVIINNVVWFLEKLAMRGELTWAKKEDNLAQSLGIFEDMIVSYIDRLIEKRDRQTYQNGIPNHPAPGERAE